MKTKTIGKKTPVYFLSLVVFLFSTPIKAQNQIPDSLNILILKNYKPQVNDANRLNVSPQSPPLQESKPRLDYKVLNKQFQTGFDPEPITPAKMQNEPVKKVGIGYIKAGFGNYTMPLGEFYLANKRSKTFNYGIGFKHLSSLGQLKKTWFTGFSDNQVDTWGKYFVGKLMLEANVMYDRNVLRYYGFTPPDGMELNKSEYKNILQHVETSVGLSNINPSGKSIFDGLRITYHHFRSNRPGIENNVFVDGKLKYLLKEKKSEATDQGPLAKSESSKLRLGLWADYYQFQAISIGISQPNTLIGIAPGFVHLAKTWSLELGGSLVWDIKNKETSTFIYPNAKISFSLVEDLLGIFAGVKGGLQRNSLRSLATQNPFYAIYTDTSSFNMYSNTSTTYDAYGGLQGKFSSNTSFKLEMHGQGVKNLPLFVNDSSGKGNYFNVMYANGTVLNPHLEASFIQKERLSFFFKFDYFHYLLENNSTAWHRPNINSSLSANYVIQNKFIVKAEVYYISRQFARTYDNSGAIVPLRLNGLADVNVGLEYRFNKKFGAWISLNNIAAYRYQRWNQYPSQRFNCMIGATANF